MISNSKYKTVTLQNLKVGNKVLFKYRKHYSLSTDYLECEILDIIDANYKVKNLITDHVDWKDFDDVLEGCKYEIYYLS